MMSNDFGDNGFPSIRPAVNAGNRWRKFKTRTGCFMWFKSDLCFNTTTSADDSTIFRLNQE